MRCCFQGCSPHLTREINSQLSHGACLFKVDARSWQRGSGWWGWGAGLRDTAGSWTGEAWRGRHGEGVGWLLQTLGSSRGGRASHCDTEWGRSWAVRAGLWQSCRVLLSLLLWTASVQFSSVQSLSRVCLSATPWTTQLARPPRRSPTPGACSHTRPSVHVPSKFICWSPNPQSSCIWGRQYIQVKRGNASYTLGGVVNWLQPLWRTRWEVPQKTKDRTAVWASCPTPGQVSREKS